MQASQNEMGVWLGTIAPSFRGLHENIDSKSTFYLVLAWTGVPSNKNLKQA
jgi:hypothetical protein